MPSTLEGSGTFAPPLLPASFDRDAAYDAASWRSDEPGFLLDKPFEHDDVEEDTFLKSGLRGRRVFALWTFLAILLVVALCNLALMASLLTTLSVTMHGGIRAETVTSDLGMGFSTSLVSFLSPTFLRDIVIRPFFVPSLSSFPNESLDLSSDDAIHVRVSRQRSTAFATPSSCLRLGPGVLRVNATRFRASGLDLGVEGAGIRIPSSLSTLWTPSLTTASVSAPVEEDLVFDADSGNVSLTGSEGVFFKGRRISLAASEGGDVRFVVRRKGEGGSMFGGEIILDGASIFLNPRRLLKLSNVSSASGDMGYIICVCASNGRLFRLRRSSRGCNLLDPIQHPC